MQVQGSKECVQKQEKDGRGQRKPGLPSKWCTKQEWNMPNNSAPFLCIEQSQGSIIRAFRAKPGEFPCKWKLGKENMCNINAM